MPNTFSLIASSTVGAGGAASIDFTSIPQTYTDLAIYFSTRDNGGGTLNNTQLTFNGNASSYTEKLVYGNGASAASANHPSQGYLDFMYSNQAGSTANTFANGFIYVPNYAGSSNKSVSVDSVTENNATTAIAALTAGLWSNTAAINRVTLTAGGGQSFLQYSSAYIYGVKNA